MTHYLKQAWQRGEIVEYRERGAEGDFWFLDPPEWDVERYEYREYQPLPMPELTLSAAQLTAVDLARTLVEKRRARDQAAIAAERFSAAYKPLPWWRRVQGWLLLAAVIGWFAFGAWMYFLLFRSLFA
jgi:hypothetical protein